MWVTVGPLLLKLLFSVAVSVAQRMGVMNKVDAITAKGAFDAEQFISHLITYSDPSDFPQEVKS
jgi:hypothetical protein